MECEKENFVVIVPENILQAIKNSSNLSIDVAEALNVTNVPQKDDSSETPDFSNLPSLSNGNMLFWLPSDNIGVSNDTSAVSGSESEGNLIFRPFALDDVGNTVLSSSGSKQLILQSDGETGASKSQTLSLVDLPSGSDVNLVESVSTQNNIAKSRTISAEVLDGVCETNLYIDQPSSSAEKYFVVDSSSNQSRTITSKSTTTVPIKIVSHQKQSVIVSPSLSRQKEVKQTADKATYTNGVKTLHKCDIENCNQTFKSLLEWRKHKTTVHGKEKMYKCKYANCLWSFSTPYKLRRHLESHYKRKPFSCTFPGCNAVFSSDYNQRAHMKLHTTIKPSRICKICGKILESKRELSVHLRKVHDQGPEFKCNICKNNFCTLAALVIHKRSHKPRNEFECPVCEKKFGVRYNLKIHIYTHTGEKPYKCDECDCGFASLSRLNRHSWIHKERRFKCTEEKCDKKFYRLQHLIKHMRKIHKTEPTNENSKYYTCEACGLRCSTAHGLERHKRKCAALKAHMEKSQCDGKTNLLDLESSSMNVDNDCIVVEIDSCHEDALRDNDCASNNEPEILHENSQPPVDLSSGCILANTSEPSANSSVDGVVNLDANWTSSSIETLAVPSNPSQYLACSTNSSTEEGFQVPLIDDMNVLQVETTQKFLQQNEAMSSCVDSVADPAISIEEAPGQDVLQQYVISTHDLGMIATREENSIPPNADADEPPVIHPAPSPALFEDDIPLVSMENDDGENFSNTTINIDDINWFVLCNRDIKDLS